MFYDAHITVYLNSLLFAHVSHTLISVMFLAKLHKILVFLQVNIVCKQMRTGSLRHSAQYKCALRMSCYACHVPPIDKGRT